MTDHLPDCDDYAFSGAGFHPKCERICICRQVRRIEHRVLQEQIEGRQSAEFDFDHIRDDFRDVIDALKEGS